MSNMMQGTVLKMAEPLEDGAKQRTIDLGTVHLFEDKEETLTDAQFFWFHETLVSKVTKYKDKIIEDVYEDALHVADEF